MLLLAGLINYENNFKIYFSRANSISKENYYWKFFKKNNINHIQQK